MIRSQRDLVDSNFGKSTAIYKFELIKRAKAEAKKAHPGVELD